MCVRNAPQTEEIKKLSLNAVKICGVRRSFEYEIRLCFFFKCTLCIATNYELVSKPAILVYKKNSFSNILKFHYDQSKPLQPLVLCIAEINWLHKAIHKSQKSFIMCYAEKAIDSLFWKMSDAPVLIVKY